MFKRIILMPRAWNPFGQPEYLKPNMIIPWQDQGLMSADDALLNEGVVGTRMLYQDLGYTVHEETYYEARWGGHVHGLPPFPKEPNP